MESGAGFSGAVTLVFGVFSWAQFPALCGFMFSSTKAGADNFRYSLWLGGLLAVIGLASGARALQRGPRGALLIAGMVLNIAFVGAAACVTDRFDAACHALYMDVTEE
jgi:hypothetical protein